MNRTARLEVRPTHIMGKEHFVTLVAGNGETLLTGETHPERYYAERSQERVLDAMVQVLRARGYRVQGPLPKGHDLEDDWNDSA